MEDVRIKERLGHEEDGTRFSRAALLECLKLFYRRRSVKAAAKMKVEEELSAEGREVLRTIERERQEAWQAGVKGDWWGGERRRGVIKAELQVWQGARRLIVASTGGAGSEDDDDVEDEEDGVTGSRGADIGGLRQGEREPPEPVSMDEDTSDEGEGNENDWMDEKE
ncbi:MAG: hypothetical protein LQ346_004366 [Caloplaca aetnensis]|nr:MAG: hypothetical protein LQ346_004366 [Caloplaca aetnensis]